MVVLGTIMLLAMLLGVLAWVRGRLETWRSWLWIAVIVTPAPLIAVELGWATAEIGRQPWIVYGLMRTADGVSPHGDHARRDRLAARFRGRLHRPLWPVAVPGSAHAA